MGTIYYLVSWTDHHAKHRARQPTTREYGTATSKQAAIRLAEKLLPPDAECLITTLRTTVYHGRTPPAEQVHIRRR